jgi:hypothetical protein
MTDSTTSTSSSLTLAAALRLRGRENYTSWKTDILFLAKSNQFRHHLISDERYPKPKDLTDIELWKTATPEQQEAWKLWEAKDAKAMMAIRTNLTKGPAEIIEGLEIAEDAWKAIQVQYEGRGGLLVYHALIDITQLRCENTAKTEEYIGSFRKLLTQLSNLNEPLPKNYAIILFINGAQKAYPHWAEYHRINTIDKLGDRTKPVTFETLQEDLLNAHKGKQTGGATNNSGSKPTGGALPARQKKGGKNNRKGHKCINCENPNAYHKPDDCFATNLEKRQAWEEQSGRKYVPWKDLKKDQNNGSSGDSYSLVLKTQAFGSGSSATTFYSNHWLGDTGADGNVTNNLAWLKSYTPISQDSERTVDTANGPTRPLGTGTVHLRALKSDGSIQLIILNDVTYLPTCPVNLFALGKMTKRREGYATMDKIMRVLPDGSEVELCALDQNLCLIIAPETPTPTQSANVNALLVARKPDDQKTTKPLGMGLWHKRLGHLGVKNIKKTADITKGIKLIEPVVKPKSPCEACSIAKPLKYQRKLSTKRAFEVFDKVHVDTFMIDPVAHNGHKYGIVFTDEATHARWGYTFKAKDEAFNCVKQFIAMVETQYGRKIKAFRMDDGREYSPAKIKDLCDDIGTILELSTPYQSNQDGTAERSIRIILEKVRSVMIGMNIPAFLWPEIFQAMIKITNRSATSNLVDLTPYECFMNKVDPDHDHTPYMGYLRVLGCRTYVQIPQEKRKRSRKIDPRAKVGMLVGYEGEHIYRVWIPNEKGRGYGQIVRSSNVVFDEYSLYSGDQADRWGSDIQYRIRGAEDEDTDELIIPDPSPEVDQPNESNQSDQEEHEITETGDLPEQVLEGQEDETQFFDPDDLAVLDPEGQDDTIIVDTAEQADPELAERQKWQRKVWVPNPEYERMTRTKTKALFCLDQYHTFRALIAAAKVVTNDPQTLKEAMESANWPEWKTAIVDEYNKLIKMGTMKLVDRPKNVKVISSKLVFKTKRDQNSRIERYKARWVARGYEQQHGRDFNQTYASTCHSVTWKIVIAIAAICDWEIDQMDAVSAFLHSEMVGDVYVEVPPLWAELLGLLADQVKGKVAKLLRGLYGLRQAPRLWQQKFKKGMIELGLHPLLTDDSVYIKTWPIPGSGGQKDLIIVVTHVDDMLVCGPNPTLIAEFKKQLSKIFQMNDLGPVTYFLGVRIIRDRKNRTIQLIQDAYIRKIIGRYKLEDSKPTSTPMQQGIQLAPNTEQASKADIEEYQSKMGSITYLAIQTRTDIAFACSVLSRFLTNPSKDHLNAADHLLRYIKGSADLCIQYGGPSQSKNLELRGYYNKSGNLHGYSDSDFAGDIELRKSTSGFVFFFAGGVISAQSKRQTITALSTTEAEYYGLAKAATEAAWLRETFKQLKYKSPDVDCIRIYGDNQAALQLTENPSYHQRTKHIAVKYHFIRDERSKGRIRLWYCPTKDMKADGLTKSLAPIKHKAFVQQLGLRPVVITGQHDRSDQMNYSTNT